MSRPPTYHTAEEKPVSVSLRLPRALYDHAQQYISQRRISLTELLLDGLRLALETPADPRDILVLHDNTVMQELQTMVDARIEAALARERTLAPPRDTPTRAPALPATGARTIAGTALPRRSQSILHASRPATTPVN